MDEAQKDPNAAKTAAFDAEGQAILSAMLARAAFDGWTSGALAAAAKDARMSPAMLAAAFPAGPADALRAWSMQADAAMVDAMVSPDFASLKIRQKVAFAVRARLNFLRLHKEAARRAAATLALPIHGRLGAELAWKTADAIWRGLGDKSTDFNFYSKRGILTGVWLSTLAHWLGDESKDEASTHAFLDARIENVMQIEKLKGKVRELNIDPAKPLEWLAKLRYPASSKSHPNPEPQKSHVWKEDEIDEALDASFPASDPPSWSPDRA